MTPSFQKPTLNLSSLSGKKHLDVRALEALLKHWPDCQSSPEGRRFYRWISPRAEKAAKRKVRKVSRFMDGALTIKGLPGPQERKKQLKAECEQLCKDIVFRRQGVSNNPEDENYRMGTCITCGKWHKLSWGHFITQAASKFLVYNPNNTNGQCQNCNGPPGYGRQLEHKAAINARVPGLADRLERLHEETKKNFRWTVKALEMQRDKLKRIWEEGA